MDTYTNQKIVRAEHEPMARSLPSIPECHTPDKAEDWWSRLTTALQSLKAYTKPAPHIRPALTVSNPSAFLRDRIQEDSNYLMEWLWAASQVTEPEEIHYCLERALYINPTHRDTHRKLSRLVNRRTSTSDTVQVAKQGALQPSANNKHVKKASWRI